MKGIFWFTAGAAAATWAMLRGKRIYRQYVPEALRKEIARRGDNAAEDMGNFTATFRAAMAQREAELEAEAAELESRRRTTTTEN